MRLNVFGSALVAAMLLCSTSAPAADVGASMQASSSQLANFDAVGLMALTVQKLTPSTGSAPDGSSISLAVMRVEYPTGATPAPEAIDPSSLSYEANAEAPTSMQFRSPFTDS